MLIELIAGRPWAVQAEVVTMVRDVVTRDGFGGLRAFAGLKRAIHSWDDDDDAPSAARRSPTKVQAGVAVVPIIGMVTQRGDVIDSAYTRSSDAIAAEVEAFAADSSVDSIVLEVDSPGGEVFGVAEAFAAIRAAAKKKPVVAHANSIAASAGYWLFCGATEGWVTTGGMVGSVGVYSMHRDLSKALEMAGEKWTFISAGKYKVEGNPAEAISPEALAAWQTDVDRYYTMFTRDISRGQGVSVDTVRNGFGEGRMVGADAAVEQRMADRVGTLADAMRRAAWLGAEHRRGAATAQLAAARFRRQRQSA